MASRRRSKKDDKITHHLIVAGVAAVGLFAFLFVKFLLDIPME